MQMHGTTAQGSSPVVLKRPALNVPVHFAADRPDFPENMVSVCICSLAHQVLYMHQAVTTTSMLPLLPTRDVGVAGDGCCPAAGC